MNRAQNVLMIVLVSSCLFEEMSCLRIFLSVFKVPINFDFFSLKNLEFNVLYTVISAFHLT